MPKDEGMAHRVIVIEEKPEKPLWKLRIILEELRIGNKNREKRAAECACTFKEEF
jgi:hypothetical protein